MAATERRNARIARRSVELVERRRKAQLPGKRMLASARADEKHLHTRTLASVVAGFAAAAVGVTARCTTTSSPGAALRRGGGSAQTRHSCERLARVSSTARVVGVSPHPGWGSARRG